MILEEIEKEEMNKSQKQVSQDAVHTERFISCLEEQDTL